MTTVFTVAALVMRPIAGVLSGRVGRVKILGRGRGPQCGGMLFLPVLHRGGAFCLWHGPFRASASASIRRRGGGRPARHRPEIASLGGHRAFSASTGRSPRPLGRGSRSSFIGSGDAKGFMPLFLMSTGIAVVCLVLDTQIRYERRKGKAGQSVANTAAANVSTSDAAALNTAGVCEDKPLPKTYLGFEAGVFVPAVFNILQTIAVSSITAFLSGVRAQQEPGLYRTVFPDQRRGDVPVACFFREDRRPRRH